MSRTSRSISLLLLPLALISAALVLRWFKLVSPGMNLLPNFSPWMALAFTGTLVMPRALPWPAWPLAMLGVNLAALGFSQAFDPESLAIYCMYGIASFLAARQRGSVSVAGALGGVLACGLVFYAVTNTAAWFVEPAYARTFAGWLQAQTTGLPQYPPSWTFLRNSLFSDLGFSLALLCAFNVEARLRSALPMPWMARLPA